MLIIAGCFRAVFFHRGNFYFNNNYEFKVLLQTNKNKMAPITLSPTWHLKAFPQRNITVFCKGRKK